MTSKKTSEGGLPTDLDFEKALMFFHAYMYGPLQGKLRLYRARAVRSPGKVMTSDWEVFASMLVKDVGKKLASGIDLTGYEVKSAENEGSFEYQYHKNTGKQRLQEHTEVGHLFFSHADNLRIVELRYAHGRDLRDSFFDKWLGELPDPYDQQRFRRSIPFGWVKSNGQLLMKLENGEITFPKTTQALADETSGKLRPSESEGEEN